MKEDSVVAFARPGAVVDPLSELSREGPQRLIAQAVSAELKVFLERFETVKDSRGRAAAVRVPKVRNRLDEPVVFHSELVPPYVRRARSVDAALPWLYLKGISTGDMSEALAVLVGPEAAGLPASVVSRLKAKWAAEYETWKKTPLDKERRVYVWADGIYSGLRAEGQRLCALVVIGVNERGQKRLLAIEDGVRESTQSWRELLLGLKARKLTLPPKLAVGDGALGFWAAIEEVYPETRQQRCWVHKMVNVLNYLPKSVQPKAKAALAEIWMAETRDKAQAAFDRFIATFRAKYPKATECLVKDRQALLAFYDFPAEHWLHIRSTNVIESTFATIRHSSDRAKGCVTRQTMLSMMFKLGRCAERGWRRLRGFEWLAKVIAGGRFKDGEEHREAPPRKGKQELSRVAA